MLKSKNNAPLADDTFFHHQEFSHEEFDDIPLNVTYMNNSGKTPLPRSVKKEGELALVREGDPWTLQTSCTESIRYLFAQIIHATCADIAIVPSTGFAMTLFAKNLFRESIAATNSRSSGVQKKKRVLILQDGMSSEVYAWQECVLDVEFVIVPHPQHEDEGWTPLILECLEHGNHGVDVCCLPQVHWSDGSFVDLKIIGRYCNEHGIKLVVDGTQSIGIMDFNVKEIMCDAAACSVHKWLLSPHGMSLVYIHPKYHNSWLPLDQHERSRVAFQDDVYDALENKIGPSGYPDEFLSGARRCDSGGKKNPILEPMICQGLKLVNSIDLEKAQTYLKRLTDEILEGGKRIGFDVQPGPRCGHIIGLRPRTDKMIGRLTPEKMVHVASQLQRKGIFLAVRSGAFRISPYLYTTSKDVKRLITTLKEECETVQQY